MAPDNKSLGRFILDGIPPAPRGVPQIEVTFDLDANGILNVTAKDKATGKEQSIKITGSTGLSKDEIEKMTKEAEAHAEEDQKRKEQIEVRNTADNLIYTAEKTLKDAGEKVKKEDKQSFSANKEKVEAEIKNVKDVLGKTEATKEEIEEASKKLSEELQKVGAAMYQAQQTPPTKEKKEEKKEEPGKKEAEEGEVVED